MGITLGFVGAGSFGSRFVPLYQDHPEVERIVLCDLKPDLLERQAREFGITETCGSLDELLARDDVDAVAIYTQHWLHAEQAIAAMKAGKHVTTAVPAAYSIDQCQRLVETAARTGRTYSVQETSVYYPGVAYARERYRKGDFGYITYAEARYFHDWSHGMEEVHRRRYGPGWEQHAGEPPMQYITHSTSCIMSVTGAHATEVSCLGYSMPGDEIYDSRKPHGNSQSNQVAMLKMSDGSIARIAEFRRIAHTGEVAASYYGTKGSLQCDPYQWWDLQGSRPVELTRFHNPLPDKLVKYVFGGHQGSHPYLVHDFVSSVVNGTVPECNVWAAARHNLPGLAAVESAKRSGEWMKVPDFGDPPAAPGEKPGVRRIDDGFFQKH